MLFTQIEKMKGWLGTWLCGFLIVEEIGEEQSAHIRDSHVLLLLEPPARPAKPRSHL